MPYNVALPLYTYTNYENLHALIDFNIANHRAMYYLLALPNCPQAGSFPANSFRHATLKGGNGPGDEAIIRTTTWPGMVLASLSQSIIITAMNSMEYML